VSKPKPPEDDGITGAKGLEEITDVEGVNADLEIRSEQKAEAALALIIYGASWTKAAKMIGYSSAFRCRQAVERVLAQDARSTLDRDKMRIVTERRLNKLLQSVMGKALDPDDPQHLAYNARAFALTDRIAKLWGVDAPQQFQITATDERISAWVGQMRALAGADQEAEEANILDEGEQMEGELDAESTG
jgi:hypothetical protein